MSLYRSADKQLGRKRLQGLSRDGATKIGELLAAGIACSAHGNTDDLAFLIDHRCAAIAIGHGSIDLDRSWSDATDAPG